MLIPQNYGIERRSMSYVQVFLQVSWLEPVNISLKALKIEFASHNFVWQRLVQDTQHVYVTPTTNGKPSI
jgi:hypothetical protein